MLIAQSIRQIGARQHEYWGLARHDKRGQKTIMNVNHGFISLHFLRENNDRTANMISAIRFSQISLVKLPIFALLICLLLQSCSTAKKDETMDIDSVMDGIHHRKRYPELTEEILKSAPDEELIQLVFDHISDEIVKEQYEKEYEIIKKQSKGIQIIWAVWLLDMEVNNGGFNQYFYNSSGQFAEEAYSGCLDIGAPELAKAVDGAIKTLFKEVSLYKKTKDAGTMAAFLESYDETKLGEWDREYLKHSESINALLVKYIRSNYSEFTTKQPANRKSSL